MTNTKQLVLCIHIFEFECCSLSLRDEDDIKMRGIKKVYRYGEVMRCADVVMSWLRGWDQMTRELLERLSLGPNIKLRIGPT